MEKNGGIAKKFAVSAASLGLVGILYAGTLWFAKDQAASYDILAVGEMVVCYNRTCRPYGKDSSCWDSVPECWETPAAVKSRYWQNIADTLTFGQ